MSQEKIAQLESLLQRVRARAAEPRGAASHPATDVAIAAPSPSSPSFDTHPTPMATKQVTAEQIEAATLAAEAERQRIEVELAEAELADDVEVSTDIVEVDIDVDEPLTAESGSHAVASSIPPELLDGDDEPTQQPPDVQAIDEEEDASGFTQISHPPPPAGALPANEIHEPPPSSSRRPVGLDDAEAYDHEAPRHTPPPESGKQVAAATSVVPSARKSTTPPSAPPPSLEEGHTLIGGWREPGLGASSARPATGVRVPTPTAAASSGGERLAAETIRPEFSADGDVATFEGPAPVFTPATFGELLDATLAL